MPLTIVDHPLARHYLTRLRDRETAPAVFRTLTRRLTTLLAIEASRGLGLRSVRIRTPMEEASGELLDGELVIVPILRAGLGMLDAVAELFPDVSVGYIGLERDESTAVATSYYRKFPEVAGRTVLLIDPMLATGGSAVTALRDLRRAGAGRIVLICVVAAPEGVRLVESEFPGVDVYAAALDRGLDERRYIVPGLGDFGDRLYGTF